MMKRIVRAVIAAGLVGSGCGTVRQVALSANTASPIPENQLLSRPIHLRISVRPEAGSEQELELVCWTDIYHGESVGRCGDTTIRIAILGTIERTAGGKLLTTYDLEVRFQDSVGVTAVSAAGSGMLVDGKPSQLISIAGKSVIMTATEVREKTPASVRDGGGSTGTREEDRPG